MSAAKVKHEDLGKPYAPADHFPPNSRRERIPGQRARSFELFRRRKNSPKGENQAKQEYHTRRTELRSRIDEIEYRLDQIPSERAAVAYEAYLERMDGDDSEATDKYHELRKEEAALRKLHQLYSEALVGLEQLWRQEQDAIKAEKKAKADEQREAFVQAEVVEKRPQLERFLDRLKRQGGNRGQIEHLQYQLDNLESEVRAGRV